jgi:hypothetical protein
MGNTILALCLGSAQGIHWNQGGSTMTVRQAQEGAASSRLMHSGRGVASKEVCGAETEDRHNKRGGACMRLMHSPLVE